MGIFSSITAAFSKRGRALSLFKRGMDKANQRNWSGAIEDYNTILNMRGLPSDVRAMALLNRALALSLNDSESEAYADLDAVLAMPDAPASVISAAKDKLKRMKSRPHRDS